MNYLILVFLFIMAYQDYKYGVVSDVLYFPLLFFIKFKVLILFFFILTLLLYRLLEKHIGGADIKLVFIFLLIFSYEYTLTWLSIALSLAFIFALVNRLKEIRMFPFFFASYVVLLVWH